MAAKPRRRIVRATSMPSKFTPQWPTTGDRRFAAVKAAAALRDEWQVALGGPEELSPQQVALIDRCVWLDTRCRQLEAEYLAGQGLDAGEYTTLVGALNATLRLLGIHRRAKRLPRALEYADQVAKESL